MIENAQCPYCGKRNVIDHDDGYDEGEPHQQECGHCEKTFVFYTEISFSCRAYKADCLNGGEHKFKKSSTFPVEYSRLCCEDCGLTKLVEKENNDEI